LSVSDLVHTAFNSIGRLRGQRAGSSAQRNCVDSFNAHLC
jgi:hypothetical protein